MENEIKVRLIEEFLTLENNFKNIDKMGILKNKIDNHIQSIGKVDVQLQELSTLLQVFLDEFLDGTSFFKLPKMSIPIFSRLLYIIDIEDWDIIDLKISQAAFLYVYEPAEIDKFAKKFLLALKEKVKDRPTDAIELFLYLNVISSLLKISFLIDDVNQDKLKKFFKHYSNLALKICDTDREKFISHEHVVFVRAALFDRDTDNVTQSLENLKIVSERPLYSVIRKEVVKYSPKFGENKLNETQIDIMVGGHLRYIRERLGFKTDDLAEELGCTGAYIGFIERGERPLPIHFQLKICKLFNITSDQLIYGNFAEKE